MKGSHVVWTAMRLLTGILSIGALAQGAAAQDAGALTTAAGEWPTYGGDLRSTRYAPLDQINADNFSKLEVAWRFKTDAMGPRPEFNFQSTPLMVGGVIYTTAGTRRAAVALDAATGEMLWMHSLNEGPRGESAPRRLSGRGLAYWSDRQDERIVYVTPGYQMIALDAKTGIRVPGFGRDGIVDLKLDFDQEMDLVNGEVGLHAAPVIAGDVVVIGAAHLPGSIPSRRNNENGYVRGFDVADRRTPVDLSHDSKAGRGGIRDVGGRLRGEHRQHRRLGADEHRRGAGSGLPARRASDR